MPKQRKTEEKQHIDNPMALLSDRQRAFVIAMLEDPGRTKKEAAEATGINPDTVYRWPSYVDDALALSRSDIHAATLQARKAAVLKALGVKLALLDSADERVRDKAATDLLEWELGKATQKTDITSGNKPIKGYIGISPDNWPDE